MRGCLATFIAILSAMLASLRPPPTTTELRFDGMRGSDTLSLGAIPDGVYILTIEADAAVSARLVETAGCVMSVSILADIKPPFDITLTVDNCEPQFTYNSFDESWVLVLQQTNP